MQAKPCVIPVLFWIFVALTSSVDVSKDFLSSQNDLQGHGNKTQESSFDLGRLDFEVEMVAQSPRIFRFDGFLSDAECQYMREHGSKHLEHALTIDRKTGKYQEDSVRTNSQMYVSKEDSLNNPIISAIVRRLYRFARVPLGHGEQIQVGRYNQGEKYEAHFDSEVKANVLRSATVIVYISDVGAGGHTVFPMGNDCNPLQNCCAKDGPHHKGLHIVPKKGSAVLFYTHDLDGSQNMNALHGSCPVEDGEKWIVQAWFRSSLYVLSPHYDVALGPKDVEDSETEL